MASEYESICADKRRDYGNKGAQKSGKLAADRYDDRAHFIFELLQNAEDALQRRRNSAAPSRVTFHLTKAGLSLSHFGKPFDEADVRSVCDFDESTKDEAAIGRFGIGFKSVYAITDLPEIHSGDEDFAIEGYVFPKMVERSVRATDETQIVLPFRDEDETVLNDVAEGFRKLGSGALLFLRHIDEINWNVEGGDTGTYIRSSPKRLGESVQHITLIGHESGKPEVDQDWLVFHRDVISAENVNVGRVEIAFLLVAGKDQPHGWNVQRVSTSPLVVYFPTVVPTNLGFLVQGPYRTTPSRDNIPRNDPWNQYLVKETSSLLVEALRWMRDYEMLDTSALRCLPLDREKFPEGAMFEPIFEAARQALLDEPLLPRFDGGFVAASQAKLARTQDMRELFSPEQIEVLFDSKASAWLSGDITPDRQPELRSYLMQELGVTEVTTATLVPRLTKVFLEDQSDEWVHRLYVFLGGQEAAVRRILDKVPLIRLDDGSHVVARDNGVSKAFLPSNIKTGFPMIRSAVCATVEARSFLTSLGISEPDPVDDVVWNLLPKYHNATVNVADDEYAADIERIRKAFNTDSKTQREKLLAALRETTFVMVVDTGDGKDYVAKPTGIYIATDRLKQLFAGVPDVLIVDDSYACLRGEEVRELLEACGALRYPRPEKAPAENHWSDRLRELRVHSGHPETSGYSDTVEDWTLQGFQALIDYLPKLTPEQRAARARLIWESIGELEERRGRGIFDGSYTWTHNGRYATTFPAAFLRSLNTAAWVPNVNGELVPPHLIVFDSLGWKSNPFLLTRITFKPPIIDQLAKEAGIDPAALDLLRKLGITSVADLTSRLGIADQPSTEEETPSTDSSTIETPSDESTDKADPPGDDVYDAAQDLYGDDMPDIPDGTPDPEGGDISKRGTGRDSKGGTGAGAPPAGGQGNGGALGGAGGQAGGGDKGGATTSGEQGKRTPGSAGGRPFISYLGTHPSEEEADPDGLDQATRMMIEDQAITLIIKQEPDLRRTPDGNPGFDLFENNSMGQQVRWVEVKAMTGSLDSRSVGLSRRQFDEAREKGSAYWLYIIEYATNPDQARVLRIQNPVAHAKTFTFDKGWSLIASAVPLSVAPPNV